MFLMSAMSIFLICIIVPITILVVVYVAGFITYHYKRNKKINKIYHDINKYHLPEKTKVKEISHGEIQFVSVCQVCGKPICLERKRAKKWKLLDSYDEVLEDVTKASESLKK